MSDEVAAECFRCGAPATESFGGAAICTDCLDAVEAGETSPKPEGNGSQNQSENREDAESHIKNAAQSGDSGTTTADNYANPGGRDHSHESAGIPTPLDTLGQVFVPIEPREKGTRRPRTDEHLFAPDDPVLEAYLEAGHGYGVVCRNDLVVLDADAPDRLGEVIEALPDTAWQVSGSGEGEHYFLQVPGVDEDLKLYHPEDDEHLGEIKGAAQSYVVGPGSIHPSGNRYGPLQGEAIATVEEDDLRDLLDPFLRESRRSQDGELPHGVDHDGSGGVTDGDDVDLSVHDVLTRGRYPAGERREHPFHGSETGANFMVDGRGETFRCWRHDCTGNALHLVGIEQGIIDCGEWLPSGLDSDTWSDIFAAAREAGYDLPEFEPGDKAEYDAVLPETPKLSSAASGWDWRHADRDTGLTIDAARDRTQDVIADAYESLDHVLAEALPTLGKSYGAVAAAAETDEPVTILTGRGRKEQYEQFEEWCEEHGLVSKVLPSFTHDCDTANGEHGEDWRETVMDWYRRGATPQDIHKYAEDVLGEPLPCQREGECPYALKWDFDPETDGSLDPDEDVPIDVLIGHYSHAHKQKVTQGRTVVFDEFPDAYETTLDHGLAGAVTYYLQCDDALPFEDYADLMEGRHDEQRRADALAHLDDVDVDRESRQALEDRAGHAAAPLAVMTLLIGAKNDLGNGWERAALGDERVGLYDRENDRIHLLQPPQEMYERGLVGLDGTPTKAMWELALGQGLNHRPVLSDDEREEYVLDALNLNLVRTSEWVKPYNSADHVNVDRDAALLEAIGEAHGQAPAVITTATAEREYDCAGVDDLVADTQHYGNVLGSNQSAETRLGAVIGSQHFGDHYIQKWGAYAGETVERGEGRGSELSYGAFGDDVLTHMREHETLQAAMRFGRDGNGAVVYVHTDTLPDWVPVAGEGRVLTTWSDGMRQVVDAVRELDEWTTAEVAAHPAVDIGERQARDHLTALFERGYLAREREGCGFVWRDDGLHRVTDHGEAELEPVDLDDLDAEESAELARSTIYTWEFRTSDDPSTGSGATGGGGVGATASASANGGDRPPDDAG